MRIHIIGAAGAGKTTLARRIASCLDIPHVEFDALYWRAGWQRTPRAELQEILSATLAAPAWIMDGDHASVRDLIWREASTVIWLDYALPLVLRRVISRSLSFLATQADLWGTGNHESWQRLLSRDSIILASLRQHRQLRATMPDLSRSFRYRHIRYIRLQSPAADKCWFTALHQLPSDFRGESNHAHATNGIPDGIPTPALPPALPPTGASACPGGSHWPCVGKLGSACCCAG